MERNKQVGSPPGEVGGRVGEEAVCGGVVRGAHTGLELWQVETQDRLEPGFRGGAINAQGEPGLGARRQGEKNVCL